MSTLHIIIDDPDDPFGMPLYDGDAAAGLLAWQERTVPGVYVATWSDKYADGTTFEHGGTITVTPTLDGPAECWDEQAETLGKCGCHAAGFAGKPQA